MDPMVFQSVHERARMLLQADFTDARKDFFVNYLT